MSEQYHLSELQIALDPSHPKHVLPPALARSLRVLDVGCGAGQTLIAAYPDRVTFGIDIDFDALRFGQKLSTQICFCCGAAERLPYADQSFDVVISRVALAYTDIPRSLREIRRVLKPGGLLWMTLHRYSIPLRAARTSNWKGKLFFLYILANSFLFECFGRQFAFFGKHESFQLERGMRRALSRAGFRDIRTGPGEHFNMRAWA